ncbi:phage gp6-like head-tail connector protein [Erwinia psidii]|uniref:head-tail connector protein n=1 Tax=Erwinia psidii TaxID=69224 RepID=UPI00226B2BCB|nr:head-tail connector protein [Erwinia psidii]MCX8959437.1 phage gp6-like head-tail connector protein [Erwinia psidii]
MASELISLAEVKQHLKMEEDYDSEDELLSAYILAALEVCQKHIGKRIPEEQEFTPALKVGCLMYIGFLEYQRLMVHQLENFVVPLTVDALWSVYRDPGIH